MPSILEQYRISDFVDWHKEKRLDLSPDFQRGSVWSPAARSFLIDTILRQLPVPKVYLRTKIDVVSKKSIREVVDGQQRMRAILDFADNKLALSKRAGEFEGMKYEDLNEEQQTAFLAYPIAVDQLVNATTDDVLEVFARLNSYTVSLNGPEKRHAKWQGDFKFAIRAASRRWGNFWKDYKVLSTQQRVRMLDDALTAEMVGLLLEGVRDGGDPKLDALYRKCDTSFDITAITKLDTTLQYLADNLAPHLADTPLLRPPHLLMLFGGLAYLTVGLPQGELKPEDTAGLPTTIFNNLDTICETLMLLASVIDSAIEPGPPLADFWRASRASTQRIGSRRVRFPVYVRALGLGSV